MLAAQLELRVEIAELLAAICVRRDIPEVADVTLARIVTRVRMTVGIETVTRRAMALGVSIRGRTDDAQGIRSHGVRADSR